jgi:predicted transcriptional regulator of viral defense system
MTQQITPISATQILIQNELFAFNSQTISALFGLDKFQTLGLLDRMEQAGLVVRVEQGKFLLLGLTPEKVLSNPLYIGCNLVTPAYISFWSALHFHGFTEQAPLTAFVATTRRKKEITFRKTHFKFVTFKPETFFGYRREILAELPVVIADESKSILDSLSLPQYAGGVSEVAKALQIALSQGSLEMPVLLEYAERLQNASLRSRLGYLLELLGQSISSLKPAKGPVKLDPQKPARGSFNKRWKLYINVEPKDLFPQGVA